MIPQAFQTTAYLTVDTETTGLCSHLGDRLFAISMTSAEDEDFYIRFEVDPFTRKVIYTTELNEVLTLLTRRSLSRLPTAFHNASFDLAMFYAAAQQVGANWDPFERGLPLGYVLDTLILAHAANSSRETYGLKPLCEKLLNIPVGDQADLQDSTKVARRVGKPLGYKLAEDVEADYHLADPVLCKTYAIQDTRRTMALLRVMLPLLEDPNSGPFGRLKPIVEMEHKLMFAVLEMNIRGVRVSMPKIVELEAYYSSVIAENLGTMAALGYPDLNPSSPKQLKEVFFNDLGFAPEKRRRKGKDGTQKQTLSADKKALEKFSETNQLAQVLLNISEAKHQLRSFILPFKEKAVHCADGSFLYPNFNSVGPRTGRLSCSGINLQNVTSESSPGHKTTLLLRARECFVPRNTCAWAMADYAQVEIWVAAYLSKDKIMCQVLDSGESVHDITCQKIFGHKADFGDKTAYQKYRKLAKILTFAIFYGSGPKAVSELLLVSYEEAKVYCKNFWGTYSGLRAYADSLESQVKRVGYVHDLFGRVFFIPKDQAYKALNYVIQGTAAGILKRAHLAVFDLFKTKYPMAKIILSIHDECVAELPVAALSHEFVADMGKAMSGEFHKLLGMSKPFKVEFSFVTKNWGKKISYES